MFRKLLVIAAVAALCVVGAASANNGHGKIRYSFLGTVTAVPSNGATSGGVSIDVTGGNRPALRAMLGAPVTQTFAYDSSTEFLKWSDGKPTVVTPSDLATGDYVWVHVRAPRGSDLSDLEKIGAGIVGDHGAQLYKPDLPLYLFRGRLTAVGANGTIAVTVNGGNKRALHLLLGSGRDQTFTTGGTTIFLLWQGKVPTVIDASKLVVGDRVAVRIRAAATSSLAQVETTAAKHVGDREPASK
jgi:hypothetical protein